MLTRDIYVGTARGLRSFDALIRESDLLIEAKVAAPLGSFTLMVHNKGIHAIYVKVPTTVDSKGWKYYAFPDTADGKAAFATLLAKNPKYLDDLSAEALASIKDKVGDLAAWKAEVGILASMEKTKPLAAGAAPMEFLSPKNLVKHLLSQFKKTGTDLATLLADPGMSAEMVKVYGADWASKFQLGQNDTDGADGDAPKTSAPMFTPAPEPPKPTVVVEPEPPQPELVPEPVPPPPDPAIEKAKKVQSLKIELFKELGFHAFTHDPETGILLLKAKYPFTTEKLAKDIPDWEETYKDYAKAAHVLAPLVDEPTTPDTLVSDVQNLGGGMGGDGVNFAGQVAMAKKHGVDWEVEYNEFDDAANKFDHDVSQFFYHNKMPSLGHKQKKWAGFIDTAGGLDAVESNPLLSKRVADLAQSLFDEGSWHSNYEAGHAFVEPKVEPVGVLGGGVVVSVPPITATPELPPEPPVVSADAIFVGEVHARLSELTGVDLEHVNTNTAHDISVALKTQYPLLVKDLLWQFGTEWENAFPHNGDVKSATNSTVVNLATTAMATKTAARENAIRDVFMSTLALSQPELTDDFASMSDAYLQKAISFLQNEDPDLVASELDSVHGEHWQDWLKAAHQKQKKPLTAVVVPEPPPVTLPPEPTPTPSSESPEVKGAKVASWLSTTFPGSDLTAEAASMSPEDFSAGIDALAIVAPDLAKAVEAEFGVDWKASLLALQGSSGVTSAPGPKAVDMDAALDAQVSALLALPQVAKLYNSLVSLVDLSTTPEGFAAVFLTNAHKDSKLMNSLLSMLGGQHIDAKIKQIITHAKKKQDMGASVAPVVEPAVSVAAIPSVPVAAIPSVPVPDPSTLIPAAKDLTHLGLATGIGGAGEKHFYQGPDGKKYLFKVAKTKGTGIEKPYAAVVQELTSMVGLAVKPFHIPVKEITLGGQHGTVQPWLGDGLATLKGVTPGSLTAQERLDVANEHLIDWVTSNHDSHSANFMHLPNGRIVGVDKEQGFRFFQTGPGLESDQLSVTYHPNTQENPPLYNQFWKDWAANKAEILNFDPTTMLPGIEAIENIDDSTYAAKLADYMAALSPAEQAKKSTFVAAALARKKNVRADFEKFLSGMYALKKKKPGSFTFAGGWKETGTVEPTVPTVSASSTAEKPVYPVPTDPAHQDIDVSMIVPLSSAEVNVMSLGKFSMGISLNSTLPEIAAALAAMPDDPTSEVAKNIWGYTAIAAGFLPGPDWKKKAYTGVAVIQSSLDTMDDSLAQVQALAVPVGSIPSSPVAVSPSAVVSPPPVPSGGYPAPALVSLPSASYAMPWATWNIPYGNGVKLLDVVDMTADVTKLGGTKKKYILKGMGASTSYLLKPTETDPERAEAAVATAKIASLLGPSGSYVQAKTLEFMDEKGALIKGDLQPMIPNVGTLQGKDLKNLTAIQLQQLQRERVLDWLVGNHDTKGSNFVVTPEGNIVGVDKERAFKPFLVATTPGAKKPKFAEDSLSLGYSAPGITPPIYNGLYTAYANKQIDLNPMDTLPIIEQIEKIPEKTYRKMIQPYVDALAASSGLGTAKKKAIFEAILKRKKDVRADFEAFFTTLRQMRGEPGPFKFPTIVTAPSGAGGGTAAASASLLAAQAQIAAVHAQAKEKYAADTLAYTQALEKHNADVAAIHVAAVAATPPGMSPPPAGKQWSPVMGVSAVAKALSGSGYGGGISMKESPILVGGVADTASLNTALKFTGGTMAEAEAFLKANGIDPVAIKPGSHYSAVAIVLKDQLAKAKTTTSSSWELTNLTLPPMPTPPVPPGAPPKSLTPHEFPAYAKAPSVTEIGSVETNMQLKSGKAFNSDGGAVEGQFITAKRCVDTKGKEYYEMIFKVRPEGAALMTGGVESAGGDSAGTYRDDPNAVRFLNSDYDEVKDAYVPTSKPNIEGAFSGMTSPYNDAAPGRTWKSPDGASTLAKVSETTDKYAYRNYVRANVYPQPGESVDVAFARVLSLAGEDFAAKVLVPPTPEDQHKMRLSRLYWSVAPQASDKLSDDEKTIPELTKRLKSLGFTDEKLATVQDVEVAPGVMSSILPGRGDAIAKKGNVHFITTGVSNPTNIPLMLTGQLSGVVQRNLNGVAAKGASYNADVRSGGADQVYCRVVDDTFAGGGVGGSITVVVHPNEMDRLDTFYHNSDSYGVCNKDDSHGHAWKTRKPLEEALTSGSVGSGNEIMFRRAVRPDSIVKISCDNDTLRSQVIAACKTAGITDVRGVPIEDFVVVSKGGLKQLYKDHLQATGY